MATATYEILCQCGEAISGPRACRGQVLPCPRCSRGVFVLPESPRHRAAPVSAPALDRVNWVRRRWLLRAGVGVLVLLAALIVWRPSWRRPPVESPATEVVSLADRIAAGKRSLARGTFRLAQRDLSAAVAQRDRQPDQLTPREHRQLNQLHRQADLLARLLPVPLEEIVRQGMLIRDPEEWALQMREYRGRTVLFDDIVRRDNQGRAVLAYHVVAIGEESVRLALEDLRLLSNLPLDDAPRMLFGARLRDCAREEGGWVVHFEPDSAVLLTDLPTAEAVGSLGGEANLAETLTRQQRWLDEAGVVSPAAP